MSPPRLALLASGIAWVIGGGTSSPPILIAVLAGMAALVAARERRHAEMALAAGIAAGAGAAGLVLLPVLLGTIIARRGVRAALPRFALAAVATTLSIGWAPGGDAALLAVMPKSADLFLGATACGIAAWLAATCSARPTLAREMEAAALIAGIALPLFAPLGLPAMSVAIALAIGGTRWTFAPLAGGANDSFLPLRVLPL